MMREFLNTLPSDVLNIIGVMLIVIPLYFSTRETEFLKLDLDPKVDNEKLIKAFLKEHKYTLIENEAHLQELMASTYKRLCKRILIKKFLFMFLIMELAACVGIYSVILSLSPISIIGEAIAIFIIADLNKKLGSIVKEISIIKAYKFDF